MAKQQPAQKRPKEDRFRILPRGIRVPIGFLDPVSVYINGQRVWSFSPHDLRRPKKPPEFTRWPASLKPFLHGTAHFELRTVVGDKPLFAKTVTFEDSPDPISVTLDGIPLAVDKTGALVKMFGVSSEANKQALVGKVKETLDILHERGVPAFLAFGNLLGAVREGKLIPHDNDGDVAYIARGNHPFDVVTESFELEQVFLGLGWRTRRMSGGDFKVFADMPDGGSIGIDIFVAFYHEGNFILLPSVTGDLPRSALWPPSKIVLEGVEFDAPADPEALLAVTYGPHWRIPDPSFKFPPKDLLKAQLGGWMRGERKHHQYWDAFYAKKADGVPQQPSSFAEWVAERELVPGQTRELIDIGSGTGRDSLWLSSKGFKTLGCDYSAAGVSYAARKAEERGLSAEFEQLNLYDLRHILIRGAKYGRERKTDVVYARFLIHAMEDLGREQLWVLARSALKATSGRIYLEWRTEATEHEFGEHYRQFVQPDVVQAELENHGFEIEHCENRFGLAVHKSEDPRVCRIVAKMR